ncbi:hypothetical protein RJ641_014048 [Dillenia turbinata]|uniref:Uncharacterized protein n=1 Tax=Dillenia turbinata TaxID=194707 RepID=A0AAN8WB37_9MAGN
MFTGLDWERFQN